MKLALLLAAFSVCSLAQARRPADQARALLKSPRFRDRAWGAWYAGASHDPALGALLVERLREAQSLHNSPRDGEGYAYVQSLFDALIQLGVPVPTAVMLPFEDAWRPEILILMNGAKPGNDPFVFKRNLDKDGESALLAMRDRQMPEDDWVALNDLLFAIDPKTASQMLVQEIRITHQFCVTDQHTLRADDGSGGVVQSTRHFPKGFPPIALYQIRTSSVHPGDALFNYTPIATYYARIVAPTDGEAKWLDFEFHAASTPVRQRTLERFLAIFENHRKQPTAGEVFHPWTAVDWQGTENTGAKITELLDDQAASIRSVVQEIERRGFIKASGMRIPIKIIVSDCRRYSREPLPQIAPVREVVIP
jgi:hypothetical protein